MSFETSGRELNDRTYLTEAQLARAEALDRARWAAGRSHSDGAGSIELGALMVAAAWIITGDDPGADDEPPREPLLDLDGRSVLPDSVYASGGIR